MKRIIAITLLLCLLLSFAASALAQTRPLRFLVNDNGERRPGSRSIIPKFPLKTCILTMTTLPENTTA